MRAIAEGAVLARATAAERDGGLVSEIPLAAIGVGENDWAFDAQWTIGADSNLYRIRHRGVMDSIVGVNS